MSSLIVLIRSSGCLWPSNVRCIGFVVWSSTDYSNHFKWKRYYKYKETVFTEFGKWNSLMNWSYVVDNPRILAGLQSLIQLPRAPISGNSFLSRLKLACFTCWFQTQRYLSWMMSWFQFVFKQLEEAVSPTKAWFMSGQTNQMSKLRKWSWTHHRTRTKPRKGFSTAPSQRQKNQRHSINRQVCSKDAVCTQSNIQRMGSFIQQGSNSNLRLARLSDV